MASCFITLNAFGNSNDLWAWQRLVEQFVAAFRISLHILLGCGPQSHCVKQRVIASSYANFG